MNIQEAKTEIARTLRAYAKKKPDGQYRIPIEKQRPILLIGPPGIGKTAIMKQIADETGCGLVAYSMTHHTRQSAIGLPFISRKEYGGAVYSVTEYTMSEIVASIYDYMGRTGKESGILFLDEINCVSETLTPVMLQLLQNKVFGNTPLPEGWIIVAAGNPPEYNKSVRELDMVTLDRVKQIEVEANLDVWRRYAVGREIHPAVRTYLSVYPDHFYKITATDRGLFFVTARGWEDMSLMLASYEEDGIQVDAKWFLQYLQDDTVARSFGLYYELFRHFADCKAASSGFSMAEFLISSPEKLSELSATECLAVSAMLFHAIEIASRDISEKRARLQRREELLSLLLSGDAPLTEESVQAFFDQKRSAIEIKVSNKVMKRDEELREDAALEALECDIVSWRKLPKSERTDFASFETGRMGRASDAIQESMKKAVSEIEAAYQALEQCPQGRSALLYLTNDLAASKPCAELLAAQPSGHYEEYLKAIER